MIIQCTACGAQARLPDSKQGAKVRCSNCRCVYVARPLGTRGGARSQQDPTRVVVIVGAAVLSAVIGLIWMKSSRTRPPVTRAEEPAVELPMYATGWDSPLVVLARQLHDDAFARNSASLFVLVHFPRAYGHQTPDAGAWAALSTEDRSTFQNDLIDGLMGGDLVPGWKPYDGSVIEERDSEATVRVRVAARDASQAVADRWVEWRFAKDAGRWRAWSWERWISPEEQKAERRPRNRKTVKRTLSDGSVVIEGVVRTEIAYHEQTPTELRDEIEGLIDTLIDVETAAKGLTRTRKRLREIGKHAVPGLLKRMGAIPLDDEASAIQLNQMHLVLQDITGYLTSFDVSTVMGGTEERMQSGIKQWFGWYDRKWKKFWRTGGEPLAGEDPFWDDPDFQPRSAKEAREFERLRREREEQREKDDG